MERYLTAEEVLQLPPFAHLKLKTLTEWRSQGKGPDFTKVGNRPLYRESALNRWLLQQERKLNPEYQPEVQRTVLPPSSEWPKVPRNSRLGGYRTRQGRFEELQAKRNAGINS